VVVKFYLFFLRSFISSVGARYLSFFFFFAFLVLSISSVGVCIAVLFPLVLKFIIYLIPFVVFSSFCPFSSFFLFLHPSFNH